MNLSEHINNKHIFIYINCDLKVKLRYTNLHKFIRIIVILKLEYCTSYSNHYIIII